MKETFSLKETAQLLTRVDEIARVARVSRGRAFEDFLALSTCALSGGAMEELYLETVKAYSDGPDGRRGCDLQATLFGDLVRIMEETRADLLGDLFQGAITFGENGQFITPDSVCELIAGMTGGEGETVCDPCCGSGRMLLAAARINKNREFIGQDVDLRCVRMTAINLALRGLYGYVIWGDSLRQQQQLIYRTGFNGRGFIRIADQLPVVTTGSSSQTPTPEPGRASGTDSTGRPAGVTPVEGAASVQRWLF